MHFPTWLILLTPFLLVFLWLIRHAFQSLRQSSADDKRELMVLVLIISYIFAFQPAGLLLFSLLAAGFLFWGREPRQRMRQLKPMINIIAVLFVVVLGVAAYTGQMDQFPLLVNQLLAFVWPAVILYAAHLDLSSKAPGAVDVRDAGAALGCIYVLFLIGGGGYVLVRFVLAPLFGSPGN